MFGLGAPGAESKHPKGMKEWLLSPAEGGREQPKPDFHEVREMVILTVYLKRESERDE